MTEEIAATPGWLDERLDEAFAGLTSKADALGLQAARTQYADCLAVAKAPAAPSDLLGDEFNRCRAALIRTLSDAGLDEHSRTALLARLETVEAELAADS